MNNARTIESKNRTVPSSLEDAAEFVLSYIMTLGRWRRGVVSWVITNDAPQWVADVFNIAAHDGIVDQRRQKFVVDALKRLAKGRFVGETLESAPSEKTLRQWYESSDQRDRYMDGADGAGTKKETAQIARQAEKAEVMYQVIQHLHTAPHDETRRFNFREFQHRMAERDRKLGRNQTIPKKPEMA